jgi:hypothetical protein
MAFARVGFVASTAVIVWGCAGSAAAPASPATAPGDATVSAGNGSFQGARWGMFHSKRFELSIGLPDGAAWKIDDHRTSWLKATHDATHSALAFRSWSESDNVTRKGCYARAREWDSTLPDLDAQPLIGDELRAVLGHRDARVAVGVVVGSPGAPRTGGFVVAIVGDVRRCILVSFRTEASGPAAADEVADRLAIVSDRVLPGMKADQSFAPSREPAMPLPGPAGGR